MSHPGTPKTRDDMVKALGELAKLVTIEEKGSTLIVKQKGYLKRADWLFILDAVRARGGEWHKPQKCFEVPFAQADDGKPSIDSFPAEQHKAPEKVRTGLPKIDAHLDQIEAEAEKANQRYEVIPLSALTTSPVKVRQSVDKDYVKELAASIKSRGVLQPLIVRPLEVGYQIVGGEQRYRAAREAGLTEMLCIVKSMSDQDAFETSLIENLQRKDLTDYEVAKALDHMLKHFPSMNQKILAEKFGKSEEWISRHLAILKLEGEVAPGQLQTLTERQAREIISASPAKQEEIIREAARTGEIPSSRKIEEKAKEVALQLVDGGEEKVPAAQVTKVREVTTKKTGKAPVVEWRVEFHDESGGLCSRDVTEKCGLELENLGFSVEHTDFSEPEEPANVLAQGVPSEKPTQPKEESTTPPAKKEIDFEAKGKLCPVCGRVVSETLYEQLKKKFASFTGLFK